MNEAGGEEGRLLLAPGSHLTTMARMKSTLNTKPVIGSS
jgi:hypothetical protein